MVLRPEDIKRMHEEKFVKMQSENYGEESILGPEKKTPSPNDIAQAQRVLESVTQLVVMPSGIVDLSQQQEQQQEKSKTSSVTVSPTDDGYWMSRSDASGDSREELIGSSTTTDGKTVSAKDNLQKLFPDQDLGFLDQTSEAIDDDKQAVSKPHLSASYDHETGVQVSTGWMPGNQPGESQVVFSNSAQHTNLEPPEWTKPPANEVDNSEPQRPAVNDTQAPEPPSQPPEQPNVAAQSPEPAVSPGQSTIADRTNTRVSQQLSHAPQPAAEQGKPQATPPSASQNYLQQRYGAPTNSRDFLAGRYGVGDGTKTQTQRDAAGRPQPSPTSGNPSPHFPFASSPKQAMPDADDISQPPPNLGDHPQEGKRRQSVSQADGMAESLDMAAEQMLGVLDRMANKLRSLSQRLTVVESIIDRTS